MPDSTSSSACDNASELCRATDNAALPRHARLPINRCNLPAALLGGLTFQAHPCALVLDGVEALHARLFATLDALADPEQRALRFEDYLTVHFRLDRPEEMGLTGNPANDRRKATWLRVLRGWLFDADGREAAILKGWVESRFGLLPRHHREPLRRPGDAAWLRYEEERARGLYGTSALEAQLDLVFAYTQYEFARRHVTGHRLLYRGVNRAERYEAQFAPGLDGREEIWLLNNLSSFTSEVERAGEFGDRIIAAEVPVAKIFFHSGVLPRRLQGENEFLVIGGLYRVRRLA